MARFSLLIPEVVPPFPPSSLHIPLETTGLPLVAAHTIWSPVNWESALGNITPGLLCAFEGCLSRNSSFPDLNGIDLTPVQDTPVASRKEDTYVHFNVDIELQKHVEKLTKGV